MSDLTILFILLPLATVPPCHLHNKTFSNRGLVMGLSLAYFQEADLRGWHAACVVLTCAIFFVLRGKGKSFFSAVKPKKNTPTQWLRWRDWERWFLHGRQSWWRKCWKSRTKPMINFETLGSFILLCPFFHWFRACILFFVCWSFLRVSFILTKEPLG